MASVNIQPQSVGNEVDPALVRDAVSLTHVAAACQGGDSAERGHPVTEEPQGRSTARFRKEDVFFLGYYD